MSLEPESFTPVSFDLRKGPPFPYSPSASSAISQVSGSDEFEDGIDLRDGHQCIVCGLNPSEWRMVHIVPKTEEDTWDELRVRRLIPRKAKSAKHEPRNAISLCGNHELLFTRLFCYIRWVPHANRFVLINHSGTSALREFHGRAVRLYPNDPRVPFHGAFLYHEMRVRARWPFADDTPISLPVPWQTWIQEELELDAEQRAKDKDKDKDIRDDAVAPTNTKERVRVEDASAASAPAPPRQTMTFTDPFGNPADLEALKRSFAEQPNFKAALVEGESWEGTAEENVAKWQGIMGAGNVE